MRGLKKLVEDGDVGGKEKIRMDRFTDNGSGGTIYNPDGSVLMQWTPKDRSGVEAVLGKEGGEDDEEDEDDEDE